MPTLYNPLEVTQRGMTQRPVQWPDDPALRYYAHLSNISVVAMSQVCGGRQSFPCPAAQCEATVTLNF